MESQQTTRDDVIAAYRLFLDREPESGAVIDEKLAAYPDRAALRQVFLASDEFRQSLGEAIGHDHMTLVNRAYWDKPRTVEYRVAPEVLHRLTARIRDQWTALGESDPYWSVLTDERFRLGTVDNAALADFHASGKRDAALVEMIARKDGVAPPAGTCLELGCGVGRITRYLAERFDHVTAVDISAGNLALCRRYLAAEGVGNVDSVLIDGIEALAGLPSVDFFFSLIVLQHNSPPVQYEMLRILLGKIAKGGGCLFQVVADWPGYQFDVKTYLASDAPVMEVHALPMAAVLSLLREAGLELRSVRMDPWTGFYGSYTFSAFRP